MIDWLRGLAVVLMIQAHGFDAWLAPEAKVGLGYWWIRHLSGLPSRMFLFLVGVSAAIRFETQLAKGVQTPVMRIHAVKRGLQIVGLAYLFRLQEHILAGFKGGWMMLFRVDILNAIGAAMVIVAFVSVPRAGRRQITLSLLVAALFLGLGPFIGPAHFPSWLPRPLTSYFGGQRPMSWFPVFPWAAWSLLGVAVGHIWIRESYSPRRQARCFLLSGAIGLAMTGAVVLVWKITPDLIHYPSDLVRQMGPGAFFFRLGLIGTIAALAWIITRATGNRYSAIRQLGQTSLLIYWIHVDLCYGGIARPLRGNLDIPTATTWIAALIFAMLVVSIVKTRYGVQIAAAVRARLARIKLP